MVQGGCKEYILQSSNRLDLLTHFCNMMVIATRTLGWNLDKVRIIGSVGAVMIWAQLVLWFRLFDSLA